MLVFCCFGLVFGFFFKLEEFVLISSGMYKTLELQFCLDSCACTVSDAECGDSPHNPVWVYGVFSSLLIEQNTRMLK